MAEILGLASAGAGLASLAIQLVESAQKLKSFCSYASNARETISSLSNDVELTAMMLRNLERYRLTNDVRNDMLLWTSALSGCKSSSDQSEILLGSSKGASSGHRLWASCPPLLRSQRSGNTLVVWRMKDCR